VFVTVGAGDTFATVRILLKLLSANGIPLRTELVQRSRTWLRSYARHEEEQSLCRLIDRYVTSDATTDQHRFGSMVRRLRLNALIRVCLTSA
jgi:hypothetical protein